MNVVGPAPDSPRAAPPVVNRLSLPLLLLAAGLIVTLGFALTQQNSARRERELRFINGAASVRSTLSDAIDARTAEFETAVNFIASTHPVDVDAFESFFALESDETDQDPLDPGVVFVEEVFPEDIDDMVERERAAGSDDFRFTSVDVVDGRPHLVATRSARAVEAGGVPIRGLDLAPIQERIVDGALPRSGYTLSALESDSLLSLFLGQSEVETIDQTGLEPVVVAMVGAVPGDDDQPIGWALWFFDLGELIEALDLDSPAIQDLNVSVGTPGMAQPVGQIRRPGSTGLDGAELSDSFEITTSSLTWNVDVWAVDRSGEGTGLFDQEVSWEFGLSITALVALAAFWRESHRQRLDLAEFELEHARALASTDALTGLLNRKGLIDLARELPSNQPATLFFFDLDAFKSVNDAHGHHAGDEVLCRVADSVRSIIRPGDYVGRLGGDEFVIFVPGVTGAAYEKSISKRIITAVSAIDADVSCSLGVSSRDVGETRDVEDMLREADRAMYEAKRGGGGRYVLSS